MSICNSVRNAIRYVVILPIILCLVLVAPIIFFLRDEDSCRNAFAATVDDVKEMAYNLYHGV